jgi:hypothetical protein
MESGIYLICRRVIAHVRAVERAAWRLRTAVTVLCALLLYRLRLRNVVRIAFSSLKFGAHVCRRVREGIRILDL